MRSRQIAHSHSKIADSSSWLVSAWGAYNKSCCLRSLQVLEDEVEDDDDDGDKDKETVEAMGDSGVIVIDAVGVLVD